MTEGATGARPRAAVSFHPVAGGGVLFDAARGRLFALNPVAGLNWLCVRDGLSGAESTLELANAFAVDAATAAEWHRMSTDSFRGCGLLLEDGSPQATAVAPPSPMSPKRVARPRPGIAYRVLDRVVRVTAPQRAQAAVDSFLGNLRVDPATADGSGCTEIGIHIVTQGDDWGIAVDGQFEATCALASIATELKRLLLQVLVPATPHLLTLHAAGLQRNEQTLLLAGPSGAGKTTLSVALTRAGWSYGSDEMVLIGRDFDLRPLPLPPCIKAGAAALVESWFPELRYAHQHQKYGRAVKYLSIKSSPLAASPAVVVFVRFDPGGPTEMRSLDQFDALERLFAQCVFVPPGFHHDDVELLLRWHGEQRYFELAFRDCDTAVASLAAIVEPNTA